MTSLKNVVDLLYSSFSIQLVIKYIFIYTWNEIREDIKKYKKIKVKDLSKSVDNFQNILTTEIVYWANTQTHHKINRDNIYLPERFDKSSLVQILSILIAEIYNSLGVKENPRIASRVIRKMKQ